MSLFLGIDAGTSNVKAVVIDMEGNLLGVGSYACSLITPRPGWAEQDPEEWWAACNHAVVSAVQTSGRGGDITAIGVTGQQQGCTILDHTMSPLMNSIIWMDQRSSHEVEEVNQMMPPGVSLQITANYCLNSFWAPKLLWIKKNRPDLFKKIFKVLFTKEYLIHRMTGEIMLEVSDASLTFLMDVPKRAWSDTMFQGLNIQKSIVPDRLVESQAIAGYLKPEIAENWGLKNRIPIVAGGGDQIAGAVGSGIIEAGMFSCSIGTSAVVFGCAEKPFIDLQSNHGIYSMAYAIPDMWCFDGLVMNAGGAFRWLRDTIFQNEYQKAQKSKEDIYDYMTGLAAKTQAGSKGLVFLPYLNGEKTPILDENARGVFCGLSYLHGQSELVRSVMEGVAFALRDMIEILRGGGVKVTEIRATGGGAKSKLWCQILADVFQADVLTTEGEHAPAIGAAILAASGTGAFSDIREAVAKIIRITDVSYPIQSNVDCYDEYYRVFHELYLSLKKIFVQQSDLINKYF